MEPDYGIDLHELERAIEEAEVLVLRFQVIAQRLLLDVRAGDGGPPQLQLVPPVGSAEERYRYLQRLRPQLSPPERITVAAWPRYVQVLEETGLWQRITDRLVAVGGPELTARSAEVFAEVQRAERAEVSIAIRGGQGYESLWERAPSP